MSLSHRVGPTWRLWWRSGSCCGARGLLISRSVEGCWRRVGLSLCDTWCLRLFPHSCWLHFPGRQTCQPLWCLPGEVALELKSSLILCASVWKYFPSLSRSSSRSKILIHLACLSSFSNLEVIRLASFFSFSDVEVIHLASLFSFSDLEVIRLACLFSFQQLESDSWITLKNSVWSI